MYKLYIILDSTKPDGTPRKIVDNSIAKKYGWKAKTSFKKGLELTYKNFIDNI